MSGLFGLALWLGTGFASYGLCLREWRRKFGDTNGTPGTYTALLHAVIGPVGLAVALILQCHERGDT